MRHPLMATMLVLALFASPAFAKEKKDDAKKPEVKEATAKEYKLEKKVFDRDFDTVDIDFKLEALKRFSKCVHKDVTKELLKLAWKHKDKHVRAQAAKGLMYQKPYVKQIGPRAAKLLENKKEDPKVLTALVYSIGVLKYTKAWERIADLIAHDDDKVVIACFWTLGEWKDLRAWREIQMFWEMYPTEGKWATGTVTVDTGADTATEQKLAKAKWKAKYGNAQKQRPRPDCVKALKEAVKKMAGTEIKKHEEWREWCKENKKLIKKAERSG
ncbi:MAG: HEAT repeat domain-containing protein [Planctomycetota bacterium]